MPEGGFFENIPLVWLFFMLALLLWFAYETGFRFGRWRREHIADASSSQAGVVVGSLFALSAFFLAFTFGNVSSRFDARKQLVGAEANVVGTAYLRTQLIPQPEQAVTIELLRKYVDLRLLGGEAGGRGEMETLLKAIVDSEKILDELWQQVLALNRSDSVDPVVRGLFIESINEVIDTHSRRITIALKRMPTVIVISIGLTLMLTMSVLGYQGGLSGVRSIFVITALILSLSFICMLIASLERPGATLFDVSQKPMLDLKNALSR